MFSWMCWKQCGNVNAFKESDFLAQLNHTISNSESLSMNHRKRIVQDLFRNSSYDFKLVESGVMTLVAFSTPSRNLKSRINKLIRTSPIRRKRCSESITTWWRGYKGKDGCSTTIKFLLIRFR